MDVASLHRVVEDDCPPPTVQSPEHLKHVVAVDVGSETNTTTNNMTNSSGGSTATPNGYPPSSLYASTKSAAPASRTLPEDTAPAVKNTTLSHAADLIRTLDSACTDMNTSAATAARDAEEARRNARAASEMVRNMLQHHPNGSANNNDDEFLLDTSYISTASSATTTASDMLPSPPRRRPVVRPPPPSQKLPSVTTASEDAANTNMPNGSTAARSVLTSKPLRRLAEANAEDVLSLSLELERTKHQHETEVLAHEDTRDALETAEHKNQQLQQQIDTLTQTLQQERQQHTVTVDTILRDLQVAKQLTSAAEEDAAAAIELAQENAANGEQLERWLSRALQEIQELREHVVATTGEHSNDTTTASEDWNVSLVLKQQHQRQAMSPSRNNKTVRFVEEEDAQDDHPPPDVQSPSHPLRGMVAAGRQLLLQKRNSPERPGHPVRSPRASAERRRRLRSRLESLELSSPDRQERVEGPSASRLGASVESLDVCRHTCRILKESGMRLKLSGRWWSSSDSIDDLYLEALARHYTTSVEVRARENSELAACGERL